MNGQIRSGSWVAFLAGALLAFVAGLLLARGALAADPATGVKPAKAFLEDAAQGSAGEVMLGKLAQQKAQSQQVRDFGKRLVEDHGKAEAKAAQIAGSKGMKLVAEPSTEQQKLSDELSSLQGAAFDRRFMSAMVEDHQKDVSKFQQQASEQQDPDVAAFARETLPVLKEHLQAATDINRSLR